MFVDQLQAKQIISADAREKIVNSFMMEGRRVNG